MAVTISEPSNTTAVKKGGEKTNTEQTQPTSIADIIFSHFDAYQHENNSSTTTGASAAAVRAAKELRHDLKSATLDNNNDDGGERQTSAAAIVHCLDGAMSIIATSKKKDSWSDSVTSVLQLAAAFSCNLSSSTSSGGGGGEGGDEIVARAVIERAIEYSTVDKDIIRIESCNLLGLCIKYLLDSGMKMTNKPAGILKKKRKKGVKVGLADEVEEKGVVEDWIIDCLSIASSALKPRITDKISKVRNSAVLACTSLLSSEGAQKLIANKDLITEGGELDEVMKSIQTTLLWIMSNDTSAGNRALVTSILPTNNVAATTAKYDEDEMNGNANIQAIITRIKDVDVKVREAALDNLRENVNFMEQLDEDDRVEILRMGLTKRCSSTYAKTVELLCTNWFKSTKFDPIALLDQLNPVLNETVCEQVANVILRVASTIDCESSVEKGVELVQKHLSGPEIRSLQQMVLKKRNIITDGGLANKDYKGNEQDNDNSDTSPPRLSPSMALFLRVKCESTSLNKSDLVSEIITDIPTLCNLLNSYIDKLIEFNNDEDYDEMDEDEAAAYEDDQNFVCLQLIHMAKSSELEEGSRRHFISIMRRILARLATPDDLVDACVKAMASAHDKESQFLQTISEILVDVEDDDTFHSKEHDEKAIVIVRQMRIIAILSIVLESISGQMTSHPILDGFFQHLSPAITSKNAIVREHGVICLSKFCLLSGEDKVFEEFKPLLMTIAGSVEERVEVRAQAALALCDLSLIHDKMLGSSSDDSFKTMLLEMLGHSKPGIVIIAAEITAKLLLAGRLSDPKLVAWLLLIYFDTSLTVGFDENDVDAAEVVKEVGSPIRLQQLLSIFFPTYSMSSLDANDDMMASVGPLLTIVNEKLSGMKQVEVKEVLTQQFPIAKMVEYVCYNVDLADKKKNEETKSNEAAKKDEEVTTVNGDQSLATPADEGDDDAANKVADNDDENDKKEEDDVVIEASSTLLASIDVAEFLAEECDSAPTFYIRALAKILGSACIDVAVEDKALLRRLKSNVGEAEYANDDGPTVKSIKKLAGVLVDVPEQDDEESLVSSGEENEEEATEEPGDVDVSFEKENPRLSVGTIKPTKTAGEERRVSLSSQRESLGNVN